MLFNSVEFLVFFPIVYGLYRVAPGLRAQNRVLLLASYVFYGWWDVRYLFLVVLSTGLDFCCGLVLAGEEVPGRDRAAVSAGLIVAAAVFVMPRWDALRWVSPFTKALKTGAWVFWTPIGPLSLDLNQLLNVNALGWWVFGGTIGGVIGANLAYRRFAALKEERRRKIGLVVTVGANLALLGVFKYFDFFVDSATAALAAVGITGSTWHLRVLLPVGISFYTFQSLSYTIDVYRRRMEPVRRLEDYALFVMFFPVLVAGPIERAGHMMPKLLSPRTLSIDQSTRGLFLILFGLMKKVAVADGLAPAVNSIFNERGEPSGVDVALASVLFAFQIYGDFSGYTDVARGVGKILGFDLLHNFNLPYFSRGPREFWQRWHISLSTWLRDYLYVPMGGNRGRGWQTLRNLLTTMVLGGIWHGAAWTFVVWGVYQGVLLCVDRMWNGDRTPAGWRDRPLRNLGASLLFFGLTCYGWLIFRATSIGQVGRFTKSLLRRWDLTFFTTIQTPSPAAQVGLAVLIGFEILEYLAGSRTFYRSWPRPVRGAFYALLTFLLVMGFSNEPAQFIYFQF